MGAESTTKSSMISSVKSNFWLLLIIAVVIKQIPFVNVPFNWLESYFHEISHGLAALVSGGNIIRIQLFSNGAGLCTTQGGMAWLISFSGYAGAIGWGVLLFKVANFRQAFSRYITYVVLFLLITSCVLWVRDVLTLLICLVLIALFLATSKLKNYWVFPILLKVMALMVLLNGFQSPLYLIDGRGIGDGSALADITYIPEVVWIVIWAALAGYSLYRLSKTR